jgi:flagellar motor switch/type III secretory pathway protein FliN
MTSIVTPINRADVPFRFEPLASWTRNEVAAWNWCRRFVRGAPQWKSWIQEGWGNLLSLPAGVEISLVQKHAVDPQEQTRKCSFRQREIFIGRQTDNDVTLPTQSAAKRHARIFVENGRCFVEDLGTSLGTYVNQRKLATRHPEPLSNGDQIAIFPYVFAVTVRQLWERQTDIGVHSGGAEPMTWQGFRNTSTSGRTSIPIEVHPTRSAVCLEISRAFLVEFMDRLLRPLELEWPPPVLSGTESAIVEFMILSLLERVNRDLQFPYQFQTRGCGSEPKLAPETRGVAISCSLNLLTVRGVLRVFVPCSLLDGMHRDAAAPQQPDIAGISWSFPVSLGHAHFPLQDISGLERNDVVLFRPGLTLHFPGRCDRGWTLSTGEEPVTVAAWLQPGNFRQLKIDKHFERQPLNGEALDKDEDRGRTPDFGQLPVRMDVIVAQKELTLSEANYLVSGTILELDRENSGHVSLAINGKIVGDGELVDVEGRLGVKVLGWKQT